MQLASVKNACYVDAQDDSSHILRRENPADERPVRPHRIPRYDRGGPSACSGPKGLKAGSDPARLRSSQLPDRQRVAPLVFMHETRCDTRSVVFRLRIILIVIDVDNQCRRRTAPAFRNGRKWAPTPKEHRPKLGDPAKKASHGENGAPGRIRTHDPQIRSLVLYPAELPVLMGRQNLCRSAQIGKRPDREPG